MQVQATFAGGLAEHLQAAGGANASIAAQLRESLGTAAQLVTDLKTDLQEGQTSLIQLASQRSECPYQLACLCPLHPPFLLDPCLVTCACIEPTWGFRW